MKQFYEGQPNGYQESIEKGLRAVHGFQRYVGGSGSRSFKRWQKCSERARA